MLSAEVTRYSLTAAVMVTPISFHSSTEASGAASLSRLPAEIAFSLQPELGSKNRRKKGTKQLRIKTEQPGNRFGFVTFFSETRNGDEDCSALEWVRLIFIWLLLKLP